MPAAGKKPKKPEDLRALADELLARSDVLGVLADALEKRKAKTAMIAGEPEAKAGLKKIDSYILRCKAELGGF